MGVKKSRIHHKLPPHVTGIFRGSKQHLHLNLTNFAKRKGLQILEFIGGTLKLASGQTKLTMQ